jgi:ATP-dependent RNA helicase DOB1
MGELLVEEQLLTPTLVQPEGNPGDELQNHSRLCNHKVVVPDGYTSVKDEAMHGTLENPVFHGKMAYKYPFQLDPFHSVSIACIERIESVVVSAHASEGKRAITKYAIAMSWRETKNIIYTSPFKALSNQMYRELSMVFDSVGLITDVATLHPDARCLVMTTEILRARLCTGSTVFDVGWVVFDGIHCLDHPESGIVLEESIIFLPPEIKMIFLSDPMSNVTDFAEWICKLHKQPCHAVSTNFRSTPLEHYALPVGGSEMHLIGHEDGQFREDNFVKLQDTFTEKNNQLDGRKCHGPKASGRNAKDRSASGSSNIKTVVKVGRHSACFSARGTLFFVFALNLLLILNVHDLF